MAISADRNRASFDGHAIERRPRIGVLASALPLLIVLAIGNTVSSARAQGLPSSIPGPSASMQLRTIEVTGTGEARAKPDQATASFTVLRSAETARAALDAANAAMASVTAGMREAGAKDRDLQTSGFSVSPQYRYDQNRNDGTQEPPKIIGYEVRNTLTVTIRDIAKVGEILDQAVSLGVNQGGDISFGLSDPKKTRDAARRNAIVDAKATAALYAEAAGVTLGAVREISEGGGITPLPVPMARSMKMMSAVAAPSVPVEVGENTYSASVRMVFDIAP